jgi:hypothetical protein
MQLSHPPKQYYPGTTGITQTAALVPASKFPAGYRFFGYDVWRVEVAGQLPAANNVHIKLYEHRNISTGLTPIAVRGSITPTNGYQRPLTCCANATNGGYYVAVYQDATAANGVPKYLVISQETAASRVGGFANATFKLQVDFVEVLAFIPRT